MSALDKVKLHVKENYPAVCAEFSIPCEASSKEHVCPLCGNKKFRVRMTGASAGTYICTCGVKGCSFGILDLIARTELGAARDVKPDGTTIRQAAKLVDERMNLGFFASEPNYTPPSAKERKQRELERNEANEQRQREAAELEQQQIAAAAKRVQDALTRATLAECAYLKAKGFENALLSVTARGDGVVSLTDIDGRYRSVQYLPAPDAVDDAGERRHKSLMKDAPISGAFIDVLPNDTANTLIIAEGYATALSVALAAPSSHIIAAINAGNLKNVATAFMARYPALSIIIAADNDYHAPNDVDAQGRSKPNTGLVKASEAAQAANGIVVFPDCLGRKKQDWDDVRMALGEEGLKEEFNKAMAKAEAEKEKASEQEALSGNAQNGANNNPYPWDSNPGNVTAGKQPINMPVGSILRVPLDVNITLYRLGNCFKRYYLDKTTPQEHQPDSTKSLIEWIDGAVTLINPKVGRGEDGASGVFKYAETSDVIRGIRPVLRGYKDNEAFITFENTANTAYRTSLPWASDNKKLAAALRSLGSNVVVDGTQVDFYRNAYLVEQKLPMAVYGSASGWYDHEGQKFYVSQAGKAYLNDGILFEFDRPVDGKYKTPVTATIKEYQDNVIELTKGNDGLVFQVLLELASVLFPIRTGSTKAEGITVNIYGESGKGKTLALKVGASVWGDHAKLTESANATYTALVNSAVGSSGCAMRIDDLSAMGNVKGKDFENLIYSIGNGKGKLRSSQDGKNVAADEFSVICIMTAEKTITDEIWQRDCYRFKTGADARLIEQPFIEPSDMKGQQDIRGFASTVTTAINKYNGIAGREWLEGLSRIGWDGIQQQMTEHANNFEAKMLSRAPAATDAMNSRPSHKVRAHAIYSIVYAAGMMSKELTSYSDEDILNAVSENLMQEMLSNDIGTKRDEEAVSALWDYLNSSINRMGAIAREGNKASLQRGGDESAGWLDLVEAENGEECKPVFYLNKTQLNKAAKECCGMSGNELLALLDRAGYHEPVTEGRGRDIKAGTVNKWVKNGSTATRLALIKISAPPEPSE
ncbi:DUF927 domain-containing protein [Hafnia alvei]|uniref:DUF927 domain-containing protein n=1 Tax=Hafnia alvei TaxID=569 RepID=UPI000B759E9A|nr:DUF927 domain-containing protein [Hafnia alvei]MBI0276749.1 DUF927 domain-containing protein [Hafnia alvei]PNK99798.1 hypothetical protein CEQ28_020510 [Hafnia alvei]